MSPTLPDPIAEARLRAHEFTTQRARLLDAAVDRKLADSPLLDRAELLAGLTRFHRERMAATPPAAAFPEAAPWVEYERRFEAELQRAVGLSDTELAVYRSLGEYISFRGFSRHLEAPERCRCAYLPESDHGQLHIKNIDDPLDWFTPKPPPDTTKPSPRPAITMDGVGSGLHLDDEPEQIFPLEPLRMVHQYADDVPGAVAFLTRYSPFWGNRNIILYDREKRSVTIEKCSRNFIEVIAPGPDGRSWCSGMVCRDPESPQGRYQARQRRRYMALAGLDDNSTDAVFWRGAYELELQLAAGLKALGEPARMADLSALFATARPAGLCKTGARFHPDQPYLQYTLVTDLQVLDERRLLRWQRDPKTAAWPEQPEDYRFAATAE